MDRQKKYHLDSKALLLQQTLDVLASQKQGLKTKYAVHRIGVFGSVARNNAHRTSDIDLLVELDRPIGLFKFLELERKLAKTLGIKIDLTTPRAIKKTIKQKVLAEVIYA